MEVRENHVTTLSGSSLPKLGCENMGCLPHFLVSLHGGYEVVLDGEEGRRSTCGDCNLVVDMLDMVVDGLLREDETLGDLLLGVPTRDQS